MIIAICEDTTADMEIILDLCDRFGREHGYLVDVLLYPSAEKFFADPKAREADVVMLDIMMPGPQGTFPAGVQTARTLRADGFAGAIIFTTTSKEYYVEGFEVGAVHYLVKPLAYEDVETALERAQRLIDPPRRMITVPVNRVQVQIAQDVIKYAEVFGHETMLHTTTESLRVLLPLKKIEALLGDAPFLRCYRSHIINMDFVQTMQGDHFVLEGDVAIPITVRNRQSIREKYFAYRLAKMQ